MLPLLLLLAQGEATTTGWAPSAKCQAAADHACNADPSVFGHKIDHPVYPYSGCVDIHARPRCGGPMVARKSGAIGTGEQLWRCHSPSTLAHGGNYSHGSCYCSLDAPLRGVLAKCGTPDPSKPHAAGPPPPPPLPPPTLGTSVFVAGVEGYNTYRIPAVVGKGRKLLVFAEGRKLSSADHGWNDIVMKSSASWGASWGKLAIVHGESTTAKHVVIGNPAPVSVDTQPGKVVLVFCRNNLDVGVMTWGLTWSTVRYIKLGKASGWPCVATGPPGGIQLPSGRLVIGSDLERGNHRGSNATSHSMYSDDGGKIWALSNSIVGGNECQVAALPNGTTGHAAWTVVIHMRNPTGQRLGMKRLPVPMFNQTHGFSLAKCLRNSFCCPVSRCHTLVAWSADGGASWGASQKVVVGGRTKYAVRIVSLLCSCPCSPACLLAGGNLRGEHHRSWQPSAVLNSIPPDFTRQHDSFHQQRRRLDLELIQAHRHRALGLRVHFPKLKLVRPLYRFLIAALILAACRVLSF